MLKFLLVFCLLPCKLNAQNADSSLYQPRAIDTATKRDVIDILRSFIKIKSQRSDEDTRKKIYFSILPVSATGADGGRLLITSTTAGFYLGDPHTTYISSIT